MWIHNQNFWFIDWFAQWFLWVLSWLRTGWIYQRTSRFSFPLKVQEFISKYRFCCCNLKKESIRCSWHRKLAGEVFELTWPFLDRLILMFAFHFMRSKCLTSDFFALTVWFFEVKLVHFCLVPVVSQYLSSALWFNIF